VFTRTRTLWRSIVLLVVATSALAQQTTPQPTPAEPTSARQNESKKRPPQCSPTRFDKCIENIAVDQAHLWTSPFRVTGRDFLWIVPFSAAVGASVNYDHEALNQLGTVKSRVDFGRNVSRFSTPYITFGAAGFTYVLGAATHNDQVRETGLLGAEAVVDATLMSEGVKLATQRDRPYQGNGTGKFWPSGTRSINRDASMPSGHAAAAWAFARVISMQYPEKPWLKLAAYGAATTVSVARVMSREHFPSDVLVGSTIGFLTGGYVMHHRSQAYGDTFSFAVEPAYQKATRTYGLSLRVTPPQNFDDCRLLNHGLLRKVAALDSSCRSEQELSVIPGGQ
jgi:membrane-associated phospholipid phosphatase